MANRIRPFRDVDDHEVINLFAYDGAAADAGLCVAVKPSEGFKSTDNLLYQRVGAIYGNTISDRWASPAKLKTAVSGDKCIGLLLAEVTETDENGEQLIFRPRKADEKVVVRSGESVPVLVRGLVLLDSGAIDGYPVGGETAYISSNNNGKLSLTGVPSGEVGTFLGAHDANGDVLVHIHCL